MGRKKVVTRLKLIKAVKGSNGVIGIIAERLNVTRNTVSAALKRDPIAKEYYDEECETVGDIAEVVVFDAIKSGDVSTAKWYLMNKCAARGYNPALELRGSGSEQVTLNFIDKEGAAFEGGQDKK